jgi:baseplate J-like protein
MGKTDNLKKYPELSFIDGMTLPRLLENMEALYKQEYFEATGKVKQFRATDREKLLLDACAYYLYQGFVMIDRAGKMNLLKYAEGKYLENLGALKGVSRNPAAGASVSLKFSLRQSRDSTIPVPKGSRVTAGDSVVFETLDYAEIAAGETEVTVKARCQSAGIITNNYALGEISRMVDVIPYVDAVQNTTLPAGGKDIETDDELRERIYMAPEGYTTAGSLEAYQYHAIQYDSTLEDVAIFSPRANEVAVVALQKGGVIPSTEYIENLKNYLSRDDVRMLTDKITVSAPKQATYSIDVAYWINRSDEGRAETIQKNVGEAVEAYVNWQKTKIGRDIVPDRLRCLMVQAGAKRVEIIKSPEFKAVGRDEVAVLLRKTVSYRGLEDD